MCGSKQQTWQPEQETEYPDHVFTAAQSREWTGSREELCTPEAPPPFSFKPSRFFVDVTKKLIPFLSFLRYFVISEVSDLEIKKFGYLFKIIYVTINFEKCLPGCRALANRIFLSLSLWKRWLFYVPSDLTSRTPDKVVIVINYCNLEELWWKRYICLWYTFFWLSCGLFTWYNILLELN